MNYKSSTRLLGLPLVHIATGPPEGSTRVRGIAKGWIAVGDIAFGIVFAFGGLAVGALSVGGLSIGVLAVGGLSTGILAVGDLSTGILTFGGLALAAFAVGSGAIAVWAANGGLAVADEYTLGGPAIGSNAITDVARTYFDSSVFFRVATMAARRSRWPRCLTTRWSGPRLSRQLHMKPALTGVGFFVVRC